MKSPEYVIHSQGQPLLRKAKSTSGYKQHQGNTQRLPQKSWLEVDPTSSNNNNKNNVIINNSNNNNNKSLIGVPSLSGFQLILDVVKYQE